MHRCMFLCIAWTINIPCSRCKSKILPPKLGKFVVGNLFFKQIFALFCKILPSSEYIFQPVWAFVISECQRMINIVSVVFTVFVFLRRLNLSWRASRRKTRARRRRCPAFLKWRKCSTLTTLVSPTHGTISRRDIFVFTAVLGIRISMFLGLPDP